MTCWDGVKIRIQPERIATVNLDVSFSFRNLISHPFRHPAPASHAAVKTSLKCCEKYGITSLIALLTISQGKEMLLLLLWDCLVIDGKVYPNSMVSSISSVALPISFSKSDAFSCIKPNFFLLSTLSCPRRLVLTKVHYRVPLKDTLVVEDQLTKTNWQKSHPHSENPWPLEEKQCGGKNKWVFFPILYLQDSTPQYEKLADISPINIMLV